MATITIVSWYRWEGALTPIEHDTRLVTTANLTALCDRFTAVELAAFESDGYCSTNLILDDEDGEIVFDNLSAIRLMYALWSDDSHAEAAADLRAYVDLHLGFAPAILAGAVA